MAYTNIDDPSAFFQTALYTASGSNLSITNDGNSDLKPDLIWFKRRDSTTVHAWFNSSIGRGAFLYTPGTEVEVACAAGYELLTFDTDGFSLGLNQHGVTNSAGARVAWQWKANGGTTSTLSNTGPDSVVQVNSDAKFSIGTYTGNGSNSNVKHGLGETPDMLIVKRRDVSTGAWAVWHKDITSTYWLRLGTTDAQASGVWDGVDPTSEKFFIAGGSSNVNVSGSAYVFYAWKSVQGYSKFGKYIGTGNVDGPFVYTGFKPAFIMRKRIDSAGDWGILDYQRNPTNLADQYLSANANSAESNYLSIFSIDILSNGFKFRTTRYESNASGGTYIYMAFAENPFTTSTGIPATAR